PLVSALSAWTEMWATLLPASLIAGWRTLVYARRWANRNDRAWRGVLEAGACGFLYMVVVLSPGIVRQPLNAPPFLLVYGGIALVVGLCVGLVLRTTAMVVLKLCRAMNGEATA